MMVRNVIKIKEIYYATDGVLVQRYNEGEERETMYYRDWGANHFSQLSCRSGNQIKLEVIFNWKFS